MDKLLDAYGQWPPVNQLIFLVILVLVGFVLFFVVAWWLRSLLSEALHAAAVLFRGWPPVATTVTVEPLPPLPALPAPRKESDRVEARRLARVVAVRDGDSPAAQDALAAGQPDVGGLFADRLGAHARARLASYAVAARPGVVESSPGCYAHDTSRGLM